MGKEKTRARRRSDVIPSHAEKRLNVAKEQFMQSDLVMTKTTADGTVEGGVSHR